MNKENVSVCAPPVQKLQPTLLPKKLIFTRGAKDTAPYRGQQLCSDKPKPVVVKFVVMVVMVLLVVMVVMAVIVVMVVMGVMVVMVWKLYLRQFHRPSLLSRYGPPQVRPV